MRNNTWSDEEIEFLRENANGRHIQDLYSMFVDRFGDHRTKCSLKSYMKAHKIRCNIRGHEIPEHLKLVNRNVESYIRENAKGIGPKQMAVIVNERFGTCVTQKQMKSFYHNHGISSGLDGRFQKGHENTSPEWVIQKLTDAGMKTRFQKGNVPDNEKPIGTITERGMYLWKKVGNGDWKQLHILNWERANGPVPDGMKIHFRDGNTHHCDVENLLLVTNEEHYVMNSHGTRIPGMAETDLLVARIRIAVRQKQKERTNGSYCRRGMAKSIPAEDRTRNDGKPGNDIY